MVHCLEDPGEGVDAEVEETAAGEIEVHHSVGGFEGGFGLRADGEVGLDAEHFADRTGGDGFADGDAEWEIARPHGFHQEEGFALCGVVEDFGLCGVDGEGFLAEDGLVVREAQHDVLEVVRVGGGDVDYVDGGVLHEVRVGAVGRAEGFGVLLAGDYFGDEFLGAGFAGGAGDAGDEVGDVGCVSG